jgi:hypothetical protein
MKRGRLDGLGAGAAGQPGGTQKLPLEKEIKSKKKNCEAAKALGVKNRSRSEFRSEFRLEFRLGFLALDN